MNLLSHWTRVLWVAQGQEEVADAADVSPTTPSRPAPSPSPFATACGKRGAVLEQRAVASASWKTIYNVFFSYYFKLGASVPIGIGPSQWREGQKNRTSIYHPHSFTSLWLCSCLLRPTLLSFCFDSETVKKSACEIIVSFAPPIINGSTFHLSGRTRLWNVGWMLYLEASVERK